MSNQETELLLKINETEKELSELKKKLSEERLKNSEPFYALSKDEEFNKFFTRISNALGDVKIFIDIDIRRRGEYENKGFYLGHFNCPWEIVQDSLNAFVLVPKDLLPEENLLTK